MSNASCNLWRGGKNIYKVTKYSKLIFGRLLARVVRFSPASRAIQDIPGDVRTTDDAMAS